MTTASDKSCGDATAAIATRTVESRRTSPNTDSNETSLAESQPQKTTEWLRTRFPFKTAFCARFECAPEDFEQRVFWKVMNPAMKPLAWLILKVRPNFFASDLDCIRNVAEAETKQEVRAGINSLHYDPAFQCGFFRGFLRVRISGRRLTRLAVGLLNSKR